MSTQGTKGEEVYKREYRRIKSLVSSSYIRQTSVRFMFLKNQLVIKFQNLSVMNSN